MSSTPSVTVRRRTPVFGRNLGLGRLGLQAQERQEVGQGEVGGVRDGLVLGAIEVVHVVAEEQHLDGARRPEVEPKGGPARSQKERAAVARCFTAHYIVVSVLKVVAEDDRAPARRMT